MGIGNVRDVGDIMVFVGCPTSYNPCVGEEVSGEARRSALLAFILHGVSGKYTFWFAPAGGGARRLHVRPHVCDSKEGSHDESV